MSLILVGDIGGTNARFGLAQRKPSGQMIVEHFVKKAADDYPTLLDAIKDYLTTCTATPQYISLACAGPIKNNHVRFTNRDWEISVSELCSIADIQTAALYNDFAAMARSVPDMRPEDFDTIREGRARKDAPILVAGPGTGFGVGHVVPLGNSQWHIIQTEGGHVSYAPHTELEWAVVEYLRKDSDYVSIESVCSGMGLNAVHAAICAYHGKPYVQLSPQDIQANAFKGDPVCRDVCELRAQSTMSAIGDLALASGSRGGIVLAGGVSERMITWFTSPKAMARLLDRGPRTNYVSDIPVRLLHNHTAPLIGAAGLFMDSHSL